MTDEELARNVGENVRALRDSQGKTQAALAEASGIAKPHISRLEAGTHLPCLKTLNRVAKALGVQVEDLVRKPKKGKRQ